jgi:hypothetical protein
MFMLPKVMPQEFIDRLIEQDAERGLEPFC